MDCFKNVAESPKLNACLNDLVSKNTFLTSQLERAQADFDAKLKALTTSVTMSFTDVREKHAELCAKYDELSAKHAELSAKHADLSGKHTVLTSQHSELCFQHNELTRKYSLVASCCEDVRKRVCDNDVQFDEISHTQLTFLNNYKEETERIKALAANLKDNLHVTHDMIENLSLIAKEFSSSYFDAIETGALHGSSEVLSTSHKPLLLLPSTPCKIQVGEKSVIHVLNPGATSTTLEMLYNDELLLKLDVSPLEGLTFHVDILKTDKDFTGVTSWGIC